MSATQTSLIAAVIDHGDCDTLGLTMCLWPALFDPADQEHCAQVLVIMPIVVPVILIAVGVFSLYAKLGLNYTLTGIVIAHTALGAALCDRDRHVGLAELRLSTRSWRRAVWGHHEHTRCGQ